MIVKDLLTSDFEIVCGSDEKEIKGCYIGDLLSLAMSKVTSGDAWVTIQSNINIVAVASLADAGCIIICEGFVPEENVIKRAEASDVTILKTELQAYDVAKILVSNSI